MKKIFILAFLLFSVNMFGQINYNSKLFRNREDPLIEKIELLKARPILDSIRFAYADSICANGKTVEENFHAEIADNISDIKELIAAAKTSEKNWISALDKLEKEYIGRFDGTIYKLKKSEIDEKYFNELEDISKYLDREWHSLIIECSLICHEFDARWRNAGLYYFALSKIWNDDKFTYEYWSVYDFLLTDDYKNEEASIPVLEIMTKFFSKDEKDIEYIRYTPLNR